MKKILLVALVVFQVLGSEIKPLSDEFINYINSKQSTWTAGRNFDENTPISEIKKLLSVKLINPRLKVARKFVRAKDTDIPESFDAREQWPECKNVIGQIADQSNCGSCWAVSAASVMSDRRCIHSTGELQIPVSALDIIACSTNDFKCDGGHAVDAFAYWHSQGIVTGGPYGTAQGCKPYPMEPCKHWNGTRISCSDLHYGNPKCIKECDDSSLVYKNELTFGAGMPYFFQDVKSAQTDILTNGPATASFLVYSDFLSYKSGVYQYTAGTFVGFHAVRIIGWGVENDIPYWLVSNSWNEDWGDNGLFKIIRGKNELGFDNKISATLPKL